MSNRAYQEVKRDDTIVITGGSGFLGSVLVNNLIKLGYTSVIKTGFNYCRNHYYFDLLSMKQTEEMIEHFEPDVIIHLAAKVGGLGENAKNPGYFFYQNLQMGLNLIHESKKCNLKKFILCGTVCGYPKFTPTPFKEEDMWGGYPEETNAPYGIAKKTLMELTRAYHKQYNFPAINLIPVNLYGRGDRSTHVIPDLMRKFWEAKENNKSCVEIWGDGSATREFLHIDDCCEGFIAALEKHNDPEPINLGSGEEISIRELVYLLAKIFEYNGEVFFDGDKNWNGQPKRLLDISRAKERLGFESRVGFEDGLMDMCAWFRNEKEKEEEKKEKGGS